jgi:hypothetical protein
MMSSPIKKLESFQAAPQWLKALIIAAAIASGCLVLSVTDWISSLFSPSLWGCVI